MVAKSILLAILAAVALLAGSDAAWANAAAAEAGAVVNLRDTWVGPTALLLFALSYALVMAEEYTHLRKSKPVILAAGLIWAGIAWVYGAHGDHSSSEQAVRHNILEFAELFLFLLVAMTYINAMDERNVFQWLRAWLVRSGLSFRQLFWMTGLLSFFISPIADNLTTALLMCAVVLAVGRSNPTFVGVACINIVIAANAGGAFSPFGDITTLMVWQKGIVHFGTFFHLFIPSLINWLLPAIIMSFSAPNEKPPPCNDEVLIKRGGVVIIMLFLLTIITAVSFHNFLHLPPMLGMTTGLAFLKFFAYYLKKTAHRKMGDPHAEAGDVAFDIFKKVEKAEWDTLLFFFGVILCVGGLGTIGYLETVSSVMYLDWGPTSANVTVGVLSAIVDNIPVMFAVLTMHPEMDLWQWLLVTLTAGVGGSLLSIGSAAGVALMGQARGMYTFFGHLKWTPVIALGYVVSIVAHRLINSDLIGQATHYVN
ncbi:sodium:proton antiporter NhaD [Magnetofaba australis]|uniref:Putative citrate transporter n=1 Tax=Magnetofaba australis IT-1 TaxID=1434232 RepID=A0A1Y2JZ31_9PROT|nr:sodium:proton antiporter NhaD [Magnetofaba australis]OSM00136.1 putative citrate transporter [Magnetofaba australis IT-1]